MYVRKRPGKTRDNELQWPAEVVANRRRALFLMGPLVDYANRQDMYSPARVFESLLALSLESHKPIVLFIASDGGTVDVGMTLYDAIRMSPAPVITVGTKSCASMASLILAAGHRRLLLPHARVMLHLPRINAREFSVDSKDLELYQQEMNKVRDIMVDCYRECGVARSRKQLLKDIDRVFWLSAQEAIDYGLADEIATTDDLYYLGLPKNHYARQELTPVPPTAEEAEERLRGGAEE